MLPRRFLAFLASAVAQQQTGPVLSAGPTGGTRTPMAAATAEVIKTRYPSR
jgi:hypothetical protein